MLPVWAGASPGVSVWYPSERSWFVSVVAAPLRPEPFCTSVVTCAGGRTAPVAPVAPVAPFFVVEVDALVVVVAGVVVGFACWTGPFGVSGSFIQPRPRLSLRTPPSIEVSVTSPENPTISRAAREESFVIFSAPPKQPASGRIFRSSP